MTKLPDNFGIVTTVCPKDVLFAHATVASIRHYYPEIPICVIVDGNLNDKIFSELYGATTIRSDDKSLGEIGAFCAGSPRSKLIAHWRGPFEYYLYLDSDAILWGDVLSRLDWHGEDFILFACKQTEDAHPSWMSDYYFNVNLLLKYDPVFSWKRNNYFCAGAYFSKRNIIDIKKWILVESWVSPIEKIFSWTTDQGPLNYLIFSMAQKGEILLGERDIQWLPDMIGYEKTNLKYHCDNLRIPNHIDFPTIIHCAGHKPLLTGRGALNHFTAMRLLAARKFRNKGPIGSWMTLLGEDALYNYGKIKNKLKRMASPILKRNTGAPPRKIG
jgi:hypothetical protein